MISRSTKLVAALTGLVGAASVAAGCGGDSDRGTTVVATTGILADVAGQVAGPDAEIVQLVPDGADPHSFSLSAEDRRRLEEADIIVANGAGLEAGIPLEGSSAPVWELTDHAGELLVDSGEAEDPHVWMDPTRVAAATPSLAAALGAVDRTHADAYERRGADYARALRDLDREMRRLLLDIPEADRELVTSHDALGYFADRYRLDVLATAFPSTGAEAEASAERLVEVEEVVRRFAVPAIFAQDGDDPEALETVAAETGVEVENGLLVESPGPAGGYAEMLRRDAELVAASLGASGR